MKTKLLLLALFISVGMNAANTTTQRTTRITSAVNVNANTDYVLTLTSNLFSSNGSVNIPSNAMEHSVIIFKSIKPSVVISDWLGYVKINGSAAVNGTNCIVQMYNKGAIVFPYASGHAALTTYSGTNYSGTSYTDYTTGSNNGYMKTLTAAQGLNNFKSFKLKRGYMVTFATGTAGWGYSRCFVAATEDLEMNLPEVLAGKVSSYRLFHWYNFGKSGIANEISATVCDALNVQGCYDYNVGDGRNMPDVERLSHKVQKWWPGVADCGRNEYSCTMKTDNEPVNTADDTPATVDEVLGYWEDAMRTGMRLCSPSTYDNYNNDTGRSDWFDDFFAKIDARGWRCDLYDIHCYWTSFNGSGWWSIENQYNYYKRPLLISEWCYGSSWGNNGAFASNVTESSVISGVSNMLSTANSAKYVERYFYWNGFGEAKSKIYNNGITTLGQTYAATDGGLGYNKSYEYIPKVVFYNPHSLTGNISGSSVSLTWKDPNGDIATEVRIQYKKSSSTSWTTLTTATPKDKTSRSDATNSFSGTLANAESYEWRVVDVYDNTEYPTGSIRIASSHNDNTDFLPANMGDFFVQFYSKEASTDLVWAVYDSSNSENRVYYKAANSNYASDLYQLWMLETNSNGGYSLRNVGESGYLIASPNSWNFQTRLTDYTVEAANTAFGFTYNESGDYWVCSNLAHSGNYVGLWDNDKNFAAGEVLAANRDSETSADHLGIRLIPRSEVYGTNVNVSETVTPGSSYYIYNVDAGKFLTAGNSYGTHASLSGSGLKWTAEQVASGLFAFKSQNNGYLYATNQDGLWVDGPESLGVETLGGDLTSTYLTNANFATGTVQTAAVYGYGKDGSPYGYQSVSGWTSYVVNGDNSNTTYPNSGMVGGIFSYGSSGKMQGGGHSAPATGPNGESGNCLGILGVWGCGGYYYQSVTLPAGTYTLSYKIYNQSGTQAVDKSYFGFIADNGTEYLTTQKTFSTGSWLTVTATVTLTASTAGKICVGYKSSGNGSGANPHLFVDNVSILTSVSTSITHDTANSRFFTLTKGSDDTYTMQVDPENTHLGTSVLGDNRYVGFVGDLGNTPYVLAAPKDSYHSGVGSKWLLMSTEAYLMYNSKILTAASARQAMWPYVQSARKAGVGNEQIAIYEDPTATIESIESAMESLKTMLLAIEASEESPIDYSFFITNGDCASSSFDGWTLENSWGSNTTFYHNEDALLTNRFSEAWVSGDNTLDDRSISQIVYDLPLGNYQLSADIIATKQSDASATVTGVTLELGDQQVTCSTANGVPQTFTTPSFNVTSGMVNLGVRIANTNANWVAFDNFRLMYLGPALLLGDVNKDGEVNFADVPAIVSILMGNDNVEPRQYDHTAADMDKNGEVTLSDLTRLVNQLLTNN